MVADPDDLELAVEPDLRFESLFSATARQRLLRAFTVRGLSFFTLYDDLYRVTHGALASNPEPLVDRLRLASRIVHAMTVTEEARNALTDGITLLRPWLHRLDVGARITGSLSRQIAEGYLAMLLPIAQDRDVYLRGRVVDGQRWSYFRMMNAKEEKLERLRREDPVMFENVSTGRQVLRTLDKNIAETIEESDLVPSQTRILDQVVQVGTDPKDGTRYVFDPSGDVLTADEYVVKRKKHLRSQSKLTRVFPTELGDLRRVSDQDILDFAEGEVTHYALTDDKAKHNPLTRIYEVQPMDGKLVVVKGRFRGFYVDDLVNASGRMIEGVAYDYDPKLGRPVPMESRGPDGALVVSTKREPYVTVNTEGKLYLRIPAGNAFTGMRTDVANLSTLVPSVVYEPGTRRAAFTFEPSDFAAVRQALGGMALSSAASALIRDYFRDLAKHELATEDKNLVNFSAAKIGGFRPGKELFNKQKKALAWAESRGMSGVVALDSGVGKTSCTIAMMQKMRRDGWLDDPSKGTKGRFLYVCPASLTGNLPKEIYAFIEDAEGLIDRVDVMSYAKFGKSMRDDPNFADGYTAVFFDEAQALKNSRSGVGAAVMRMRHPRKVALTASPMEKSPMDVFTLAAITNNLDLNTKEGRRAQTAFRDRFCEEVGGRIVGLKSDPVTARDLRVWVKRNLYFADKRDVEEVALPRLNRETTALTMTPEVEEAYREVTDGIQGVLTGMARKYAGRDLNVTDPAVESARVKLRKQLTRLLDLSLMPDLVVPGAPNPKLNQAVRVLDERVESGGRTILFTDSKKMAAHTVGTLSQRFPGKLHAVGFDNRIEVWRDGGLILSYKKRAYTDAEGNAYKEADWKVFILRHVLSPNPEVMTLTLTSTYAHGHNLQVFSTVIHLDRDAWNSETMKQRTARAWRTGQGAPVDEIILDMVYSDPRSVNDLTLDQLQAALIQLEGELFDRVVIESQSEALGKEYFGMKRMDSSHLALNRKVMLMQLSPYLARMGRES